MRMEGIGYTVPGVLSVHIGSIKKGGYDMEKTLSVSQEFRLWLAVTHALSVKRRALRTGCYSVERNIFGDIVQLRHMRGMLRPSRVRGIVINYCE